MYGIVSHSPEYVCKLQSVSWSHDWAAVNAARDFQRQVQELVRENDQHTI